MTPRQQYREYLSSPWWRARRFKALEDAEYRCQFRPIRGDGGIKRFWYGEQCEETRSLQVHHVHYDSLGREAAGDLEVLCNFHHLVREVGNAECSFCGHELVIWEEDAIALVVNAATSDAPGTLRQLKLDEILPATCSYCGWMLDKDD